MDATSLGKYRAGWYASPPTFTFFFAALLPCSLLLLLSVVNIPLAFGIGPRNERDPDRPDARLEVKRQENACTQR